MRHIWNDKNKRTVEYLPPLSSVKYRDNAARHDRKIIHSPADLIGWLVAVSVPALLWLTWRYFGDSTAWLAVAGICVGFGGFLMYEHRRLTQELRKHAVLEQLSLALLLLAVTSLTL